MWRGPGYPPGHPSANRGRRGATVALACIQLAGAPVTVVASDRGVRVRRGGVFGTAGASLAAIHHPAQLIGRTGAATPEPLACAGFGIACRSGSTVRPAGLRDRARDGRSRDCASRGFDSLSRIAAVAWRRQDPDQELRRPVARSEATQARDPEDAGDEEPHAPIPTPPERFRERRARIRLPRAWDLARRRH